MKKISDATIQINDSNLFVLASIFMVILGNSAFFHNILALYPVNLENTVFLISLTLLFICFLIVVFSLFCYKYTIKPVLIIIFIISSFTAYFMDSYNIFIDEIMIQNILSTDLYETMDLMTTKLALYVFLLGVFPSTLIYKVNIKQKTLKENIVSKLKLVAVSSAVIISCLLLFGSAYASFFREHKTLRYYANPPYWIYSTVKYFNSIRNNEKKSFKNIGLDAQIPESDLDRELVIFVLGETARADRFSLNGYARKTNPMLETKELISFSNFWSCGTSTSVSVPCIFTRLTGESYNSEEARNTENFLDVLHHAGVSVIWLDNNSDSKGVALRSLYENYRTPDKNPVCDVECRDEGMLTKLQKYIDGINKGDIFIVLHQMGSHGPAYYNRYPAAFKKFNPTCESNQLQNCSDEEISNTYDNTILYTDYFLSKTIDILKHNDKKFETAMLYVSDHGESLGEGGIYLHGMPNMIAPDAQRHVPAIMWFGENFDGADLGKLRAQHNRKFNHENVFHTLLGMMEVETDVYDPALDILHAP